MRALQDATRRGVITRHLFWSVNTCVLTSNLVCQHQSDKADLLNPEPWLQLRLQEPLVTLVYWDSGVYTLSVSVEMGV